MSMRNILILGEQGQLATALKNQGTIAGHRLISMGRPALDFMHPETIEKAIEDINPALVINAAAYTAVDTAESERDVAYAVNASGVGMLGRDCAERDIPIIHISTDYVFAGTNTTPINLMTPWHRKAFTENQKPRAKQNFAMPTRNI